MLLKQKFKVQIWCFLDVSSYRKMFIDKVSCLHGEEAQSSAWWWRLRFWILSKPSEATHSHTSLFSAHSFLWKSHRSKVFCTNFVWVSYLCAQKEISTWCSSRFISIILWRWKLHFLNAIKSLVPAIIMPPTLQKPIWISQTWHKNLPHPITIPRHLLVFQKPTMISCCGSSA